MRWDNNSDKFLHEYARFERIKKVKFGSCLDLDFQLNGGCGNWWLFYYPRKKKWRFGEDDKF